MGLSDKMKEAGAGAPPPSGKGKSKAAKPEPSPEYDDEAGMAASQNLVDAVNSGDAAAVWAAFKDLKELC